MLAGRTDYSGSLWASSGNEVLKWRIEADVFRNHRLLREADQGGFYRLGEDAGDCVSQTR